MARPPTGAPVTGRPPASDMPPDTVLLAHHPLLLTIPAFVPAIAITVVVLVIARRDRVAEARELDEREDAARDSTAPTITTDQEDDDR